MPCYDSGDYRNVTAKYENGSDYANVNGEKYALLLRNYNTLRDHHFRVEKETEKLREAMKLLIEACSKYGLTIEGLPEVTKPWTETTEIK